MRIKGLFLTSLMTFLFCAAIISPTTAQEQKPDLDALKEAVRLKPNDANARFILGNAYADLGRKKEAIEAYKEAVRLKPDFADAYGKLGDAYIKARREKKAIEAYKELIQLRPDDAEAHYNLAAAYLEIEDEDGFREEYEIVEKLDRKLTEELLTLFKDKFREDFTPRKKRRGRRRD